MRFKPDGQVDSYPVNIPLVTLWDFFGSTNFGMARYFRGLQGDGTQIKFDQKIYRTRLGRRLPSFINLVYRELYSPIINRYSLKQLGGNSWVLGGQQFAHLIPRHYLSTCTLIALDLLELDYPDSDSISVNRSRLYKQLHEIQLAQQIVTISQYSKQRIVGNFDIEPDRISVVPVGVNLTQFHPRQVTEKQQIRSKLGLPDESFVVLYIGSEQRRKNLSSLIQGLVKLSSKLPHLRFVKIGNSQSASGRKRFLLDVQDMPNQYQLIETVTDNELADWYSAADLFVFPSVGEGFGAPVLEAMASGTPVVTTRCCSIPEITGDTAIMVTDPFSADEWSEIIGDLAYKRTFLRDLGLSGRQRALGFTWESSRHLFLSVLENQAYVKNSNPNGQHVY